MDPRYNPFRREPEPDMVAMIGGMFARAIARAYKAGLVFDTNGEIDPDDYALDKEREYDKREQAAEQHERELGRLDAEDRIADQDVDTTPTDR